MSWRAVVIGFALIPFNVLFLVKSAYRWNSTIDGPIYLNAATFLFVLVVLNGLLKRWVPRWAFRRGEMLTLYVILGMSTGLVGGAFSVGGALPAVITYPFGYATAENDWRHLLWPWLPQWLTVRDMAVLRGFWSGESDPYAVTVLKAWLRPALWWASFMGAVMWVCLCLNSLVRRRWSEEEKLPFPFVTVPVHLVEERFGLLRRKLFWGGFIGAFGLGAWNLAGAFAPNLPGIPLAFYFQPYVINIQPWERFAHLAGALFWDPGRIAICYLVPLDLLFSLLVFDLLWMGTYVLAYYWGLGESPAAYPHFEQLQGALVALALGIFWSERRYFLEMAKRALGMPSPLREDGQEAFSYRFAFFGAIAGLVYCWWFWARTGVAGWLLMTLFGLYFAFVMVLSRVRAQVGSPAHELWSAMPDDMLRGVLGQAVLGPSGNVMLALLKPYLMGDQQNNPVPLQLEALKMAEGGRMERRRIAVALALVAPVTALLSFWAFIHVGYEVGTGTGRTQQWMSWVARAGAQGLDSALRDPSSPNRTGAIGMGIGMVFTWLLLFLKLRFTWWPLHPIAYPIANSWIVHGLTPAIFLAWVVKGLILKYGGLRLHRAALPLFLGLLIGQFTFELFRSLAILWVDVPLPSALL